MIRLKLEQIFSKRGIYQNRILFKFSPAYRLIHYRISRHSGFKDAQ